MTVLVDARTELRMVIIFSQLQASSRHLSNLSNLNSYREDCW